MSSLTSLTIYVTICAMNKNIESFKTMALLKPMVALEKLGVPVTLAMAITYSTYVSIGIILGMYLIGSLV